MENERAFRSVPFRICDLSLLVVHLKIKQLLESLLQ